MTMSNIKLFENKKIRSQWNEQEQKWYFAIVDVISVFQRRVRNRKCIGAF
jgi:hypothetical protein